MWWWKRPVMLTFYKPPFLYSTIFPQYLSIFIWRNVLHNQRRVLEGILGFAVSILSFYGDFFVCITEQFCENCICVWGGCPGQWIQIEDSSGKVICSFWRHAANIEVEVEDFMKIKDVTARFNSFVKHMTVTVNSVELIGSECCLKFGLICRIKKLTRDK